MGVVSRKPRRSAIKLIGQNQASAGTTDLTGTSSSSKMSRGTFPTKISLPLVGAGPIHPGGGPLKKVGGIDGRFKNSYNLKKIEKSVRPLEAAGIKPSIFAHEPVMLTPKPQPRIIRHQL